MTPPNNLMLHDMYQDMFSELKQIHAIVTVMADLSHSSDHPEKSILLGSENFYLLMQSLSSQLEHTMQLAAHLYKFAVINKTMP